jgi:hypothetical protein
MRPTVRRASIALALTPLVAAPIVSASAWADSSGGGLISPVTTVTTTIPAPPAAATAVAADLAGIVTIGKTQVDASSTDSHAHATALALLGKDLAGGSSSSGTQAGSGYSSGDTPIGDLEILPWSATASKGSDGTTSSAEAALAHLNLKKALELWVLHSKSSASWTAARSTGDSMSDGAELNLGGGALDLKVLHAEAHSGQSGKSVLIIINGNEIGSTDQLSSLCTISAAPLLELVCLSASGGVSTESVTSSAANVLGVTLLGAQAPQVTVAGTDTSGGTTSGANVVPSGGGTPSGGGNQQNNGGNQQNNGQGALPHTNGPSSGHLPFTGGDTAPLAGLGAALAAIGSWVTVVARRRRRVTVR